MNGRMVKRAAWALALASVPATVGFVGGWSVVTVEDVPDRVVAGQPVTLVWTVRQHGVHKVDGLKGNVVASPGRFKKNVAVDAVPAKEKGQYTATLTLPEPGEWKIDVFGGHGAQKATIELMAVASASAAHVAVSDAERGRRLFTAKGCQTCHLEIKAGPSLEGRRYDAARLAAFLAKPDPAFSNWPAEKGQMPNLGLKTAEITALVAYINGDRQVGAR